MRLTIVSVACTAQAAAFGMLLPIPSQRRVPSWRMSRVDTSSSLQRQRRVVVLPRKQQRRMSLRDDDDDDDDDDDAPDLEMDWREMRARLVAQQKGEEASSKSLSSSDSDDDIASSYSASASASASATAPSSSSSSSYVYETPLIEQGTILLGGTRMDFGFALRQQFFHKSVMLLLQHDDKFTKGIILNRPSALEVDGWRVWCGHGQVAEGGLFVGKERKIGDLEINALHSLASSEADRLSQRVIKGVSYTSLEGAKALVEAGAARKEDFWICAGYSGWAPGQLQMEVETRDSWYLASADGGTLLTELLREARELPPPGDGAITADPGIGTWSNLMRGIGRGEDVLRSLNTLEDRMLEQWVRVHLVPKAQPPPATPPPEVKAGMVLATMVSPETGLPADRVLIHDQHLHKALLLVLDASAPGGKISAVILNRPTANLFKFSLPGFTQRRVPFTGDIALSNEIWLHYQPEESLGGVPVGDSGISVLSTGQVSEHIQAEKATASDFLLVRGVVQFGKSEIAGMLSAGEMRWIGPGKELSSLFPRAWALTEDVGGATTISNGTEVWWLASQCSGGGSDGTTGNGMEEQLTAPVPSDLADKALAEWLKFFAGHQS